MMEHKVTVFTIDQKGLKELNLYLSKGWAIEQINTEATNEYEVESELIFYLFKNKE